MKENKMRTIMKTLIASLSILLLSSGAHAFPKARKSVQALLCESKVIAKDSFEYLVRESKKYPIPSDQEILSYNRELRKKEMNVFELLKRNDRFDEIRSAWISRLSLDEDVAVERPQRHNEYKLFFEAAQEILSEAGAPELKQINAVLAAQTEYFNWMVNGNIKLVLSMAQRINRYLRFDLDDIIQEGFIGLRKAVEGFDPFLGNKLSTFAEPYIRGEALRANAKQARAMRIPQKTLNELNNYKKGVALFHQTRGVDPSDAEMASALNMPLEKIRLFKSLAMENFVSFDSPVDYGNGTEEGSRTFSDVIEDTDSEQAFKKVVQREDRDRIEKALSVLNEREQSIVRARFGLDDGGEGKTLEEIGESYGLTRERIRQIEKKALAKVAVALGAPGAQGKMTVLKQKKNEQNQKWEAKKKQ